MVHHAKPKPKPAPAPATTAADPTQVVAPTPVRSAPTAALTPVKVAQSDGSKSAKLLVLAALGLILVAVASASLLRLLVQLGRPQRGW